MNFAEKFSSDREYVIGIIVIFFTFLVEKIILSVSVIHPNLILATLVFFGIFSGRIIKSMLLGSVMALLSKFSNFIEYELLFLILVPVVAFFIFRKFIFKANVVSAVVFVSIFITLFYLLFGGITSIKIFIVDLLVSVIWMVVLFSITTWAKKKF